MKPCALHVQPGQPAPDFVLPDAEGREWHLAGLQGRPVVLDFLRHLT